MIKPAKLVYIVNPTNILNMVVELNDGFVFCSVTKQKIELSSLLYWDVDRQEAYANPYVIDPRMFGYV